MEYVGHLGERGRVCRAGVRGDAAPWHDEVEIAHVRVVGGEHDADVPGDVGGDRRPHSEIIQQQIERRREKPGVLRFSTK